VNAGVTVAAVVLASVPDCCVVCDTLRRVRLVQIPGAHLLAADAVITCPHCSPEPGQCPLPIPLLAYRSDVPRQEAA